MVKGTQPSEFSYVVRVKRLGGRGYCFSAMTHANDQVLCNTKSDFPLPITHLVFIVYALHRYNALNVSYLLSRNGNDALL